MMKGFDAVLLFILSVPIVMTYRILPVEGTPYWLFGLFFLANVTNVIFSLLETPFSDVYQRKSKIWVVCLIISVSFGGAMVTAISDRARTAPVFGVHDIVLQVEAAMRYLIEGKNPYKETYFGTYLEEWHYAENGKDVINPALYHFVMPPWYLLFPYIFYVIGLHTVGYFDARMALFFCVFSSALLLWKWLRKKDLAYFAITLITVAPGVVDFLIEGRSDGFALFWFLLALMLLEKKHFVWSGIMYGLALLSKQTIWFSFPFYLIHFYWAYNKNIFRMIKALIPAVVVIGAILSPFLFWDARAFLESVVFYLSGNSPTSYPISGYGLGMLLYEFGVIKDMHAYYPFIWWQIIIGLPLLIVTIRYYVTHRSTGNFLLCYGLILFIFWYLSRYLNNSHMTYVALVVALGGIKLADEKVNAS